MHNLNSPLIYVIFYKYLLKKNIQIICICANNRYRLNTNIEDETGQTTVTIFGKAAQVLVKKPCSTLTIDEGFTDASIIPPTIEQLKGQTKIFQIYFKVRGSTTNFVASKVFDDQLPEILSLSPPSAPTLNPKTPMPKQLISR